MKKIIPFVLAMGIVIAISNVLLGYRLGSFLTYAAFTYPVAFLVTDLATRTHGKEEARIIVFFGFLIGVALTLYFWERNQTTFRIAAGSGSAFLVAQLLDVQVFDRLRQLSWWKAPVISSTIGSVVDTAILFFVAFSSYTHEKAAKTYFADSEVWAFEAMPLLNIGPEVPMWVSMAIADFCIKMLVIALSLLFYRVIMQHVTQKRKIS